VYQYITEAPAGMEAFIVAVPEDETHIGFGVVVVGGAGNGFINTLSPFSPDSHCVVLLYVVA
jgi:hypothetical protein